MKKLYTILAALIPALVAYLVLWKTQDALITLIAVIVVGFVAPIAVYLKFIGEFNYELKLPEEIIKKDEKIALGKNLFLGGLFGITILVILWTKFVPFGPVSVVFPFPIFTSTGLKIVYHIFFVLFFLVAAILEHAYFNYFFSTVYNEKESPVGGGKLGALASTAVASATGNDQPSFFSNLILSLGVGLLNFAIFKFTIAPVFLSAFILALITFVLNMVVIGIRAEKKMIVSTLLRVGIAIAVLLILLYLGLSVNKEWSRKTPDFVFVGNTANAFTKWFKKSAPAAPAKF